MGKLKREKHLLLFIHTLLSSCVYIFGLYIFSVQVFSTFRYRNLCQKSFLKAFLADIFFYARYRFNYIHRMAILLSLFILIKLKRNK